MMSSSSEADPFLQVQQDVLTQLEATRPLFSSYLRIRSLSPNPSSPELASARSDLESALSTLAEDLSDLVDSVQAIESNPSQFGLDLAEVTRRKRLVQDVGSEVEDMRTEINKARAAGAGGSSDLPDPNSFSIPDGEANAETDEMFEEMEHQHQEQIMREQDQHLDGVFQTVGNLRRQADDMGRELEEQREMLEVVDTLADRVGGRLSTGMTKMQSIIRRNEDRYSSCCVAVLVTVLIILLIVLIVL